MENDQDTGDSSTLVEHLGHTSFAVSRGQTRMLIDPIVAGKDLSFRHIACPQWYFDDLGLFAAIFISHGHNDHLHPPSLLGFPVETSFYFMNESAEHCSCPPDEDPHHLLPSLGFHRYQAIDPGKSVALDDGITVHFLPAQASSEGEEQCCFLVETPDLLLLDAVDIKDDKVTRQALEPYRGRIDLAFLPTGQAVQWQGFWNQMDAVQAAGFAEWLAPRQVATCGGTLSLHSRMLPNTLERYPQDLADWQRSALRRLPGERLFPGRPPCRMVYRGHRLETITPVRPHERFSPGSALAPQPMLTAFFTGYDPAVPTRRLLWPSEPLDRWLGSLAAIRELVRCSEHELSRLLERTAPAINHTPLKALAPATLRRLLEGREYGLAARLTTHLPPPPHEAEELLVSYYAVLDAIVANAGIEAGLRADLAACIWLDRRIFQIFIVYQQLRRLACYSPEDSERLLQQHFEELSDDFELRRPVPGIHHIRLDRHQARLLRGEELAPSQVELLCYPGPAGVFQRPLTAIEQLLLDACDGRTVAAIGDQVGELLGRPAAEVKTALAKLLKRLAADSVLLVDWSR